MKKSMIFPDLEETNNPLESNVKLENFVEEFEAEKELSEKKKRYHFIK